MVKRIFLSEEKKNTVFAKSNNTCLFCGIFNDRWTGLTVDHIIPLAQGGGNNMENFQCLCGPCNRIKGQAISTRKFNPPNVRGLPIEQALFLTDDYREKHVRPVFVKRGNKWVDKKARTLAVLAMKDMHHRTMAALLRAIEKTFNLVKKLLKPDEYIERYKLLVEQSTAFDCRAVLVYK